MSVWCVPTLQVTKADIEAEKARLAAIDARPIKKVAEAKARKQKRLQVGRLDVSYWGRCSYMEPG